MLVRPCVNAEEMRAAFAPIWHYFGQLPPTEDAVRHFARVLAPERAHVGFDGDRVVAGSAAFPFDLTIPGGQVKAAGVTIVGVLPTHRRRGYLRGMMRSLTDAARERGEPVGVLWPSEDTIYGQFGYGMASVAAEIDLPCLHAAPFARVDAPGRPCLVTLAEAEPLVAPIYAKVARDTPGMFARSQAWWQDRLLTDRPWRRQGGGELQCVVWEAGGDPVAYALYRVNQKFEHGVSNGHLLVVETMGVSPQATHAIWRFLIEVDLVASVRTTYLPVDHPLLLSLAAPRRLGLRVRDGLWVRLIEVGAALSARGYATDDSVVVEVTDEFCPWNAGRWRVGRGGVEKTGAVADLACDVRSLGCVYLGGFTFAQLARALRVQELRAGAVARADAMFYSDRAPWCPELF